MLRIADKRLIHICSPAPENTVAADGRGDLPGSQLVTPAMKRVGFYGRATNDAILGCSRSGRHAAVQYQGENCRRGDCRPTGAREALGNHWLKLEIHPDARLASRTRLKRCAACALRNRARGAFALLRASGVVRG